MNFENQTKQNKKLPKRNFEKRTEKKTFANLSVIQLL